VNHDHFDFSRNYVSTDPSELVDVTVADAQRLEHVPLAIQIIANSIFVDSAGKVDS
jgi:hypothetical protein